MAQEEPAFQSAREEPGGMAPNFPIYVPLIREVYSQAPGVTFRLGDDWLFVHKVRINW
jgi:hypothetical protein